jgi:ubiquinone/menaquinone biosynthesis C-methylase UbiE
MDQEQKGSVDQLNQTLGNIDVYLLDQILKGRFDSTMKVLDAGSGEGRNLIWFMQQGYEIHACDQNEGVLQMLKYQMRSLNRVDLVENTYKMDLAEMLFPDKAFQIVICSAVLHFAKNEEHFNTMLSELTRVTEGGGYLFIRATTSRGLSSDSYQAIGNGRFNLADGSERFLMTEEHISKLLSMGWEVVEPIKTVLVENYRSMLVAVLRRK